MDTKGWHIGDSIQCQQLTADYVQEVVDLIETAFVPYETVCKAVGLSDYPEAVSEYLQLAKAAVKDGITVIAVDTNTNKVVGAAVNQIQVKGNEDTKNMILAWKQERSMDVIKLNLPIIKLCDLFSHFQIDCSLFLLFLATPPEYGGRGIAKKLTEISIEIGRSLNKGINVKKSIDGTELSAEPRPKIIHAIFSSFITQKIGRDLGFEIIGEKNYDELEFQGKNLGSLIGPKTTKATLEYKKL